MPKIEISHRQKNSGRDNHREFDDAGFNYEEVFSELDDCLDEAFIDDKDEEDCFSKDGSPIIIVPRNWPPRRPWRDDEIKPQRAIVYLDDMITFDKGGPEKIKDKLMMPIEPIEEIKAIVKNFHEHVNLITIYGSYWAAKDFFKLVKKDAVDPVDWVADLIEGINGPSSATRRPILFKFVITRGTRSIKRISASKFIYF